jgi:leucyl aminopeptidase
MISWNEIEAECGNYREGFVAVFRKYEGEPTDEKDAANRTVKVTRSSFARHMKIPESTFHEWVRTAAGGVLTRNRGEGTRDSRGARAVLRDAPLEQVERIISELPADRQRAIGAAAGQAYLQARQRHEDEEARMTPAQRREREATTAETGRSARSMAAGFATLGIVGHIEQATEELRELNADHSVTEEMARQIDQATNELVTEVEVAKGMAGLEGRIK